MILEERIKLNFLFRKTRKKKLEPKNKKITKVNVHREFGCN